MTSFSLIELTVILMSNTHRRRDAPASAVCSGLYLPVQKTDNYYLQLNAVCLMRVRLFVCLLYV